jgi:hypothetical protein
LEQSPAVVAVVPLTPERLAPVELAVLVQVELPERAERAQLITALVVVAVVEESVPLPREEARGLTEL